jgi:ABC-2 type transport system ATP-binding protein
MKRGVEIRELKKNFALTRWTGFRRTVSEVVAVDGISMDVPEGQAVAFIGPNSAGKSTTIKMLTGILHPTSGSISVLGFTPWRDRRKRAHCIGAVFGQRSQLWYHLPAGDTIAGASGVLAAGVGMFYFGLRRYESGNLISVNG